MVRARLGERLRSVLMEIGAAREMARGLMDEHGLQGWQLIFDRAKRRAGVCRPGQRTIGLSRPLTELHDVAQVRDTVLHEIAHARVGAAHGHDAVWRAEARRLGGSGARLVAADAPRVPGRWVGVCPAGHEVDRMRRPASPVSCSRCSPRFSLEHLLAWSLDGEPIPHERISERYSRLLRLAHIQPPDDVAGPSRTLSS